MVTTTTIKKGLPDETSVKAGYKQTEIGVIPEDWSVKRLGDIGNTIIGLTYSPNEVVDYGKLVHRSSNIQNNRLSYDDNVYVDKTINEKLILKDKDILICVRNGSRNLIGKSTLIRGKSVGETFGAFMSVFRTDKCQLFIYYLILSNLIQRQISQSLGATINQITNKTLNNFKIPYPPKSEEQTAIATVLSNTDALIERLEKLITKKKAIKQGTMQQLLTGKKRLPGFNGKWEVKKIGKIGEITGAGVDKKVKPDEIPVRLVNYLDVYRRNFIYSRHLNHYVTAPPAQAQRCAVKKGDIFFTPSSEMPFDIGISAVAMEDIPDVAYSYHVVRLRLHEDWDLTFRSYAFKTAHFYHQAQTLCEGSGIRYVISLGKFRQMTVIVPPTKTEQTAIATILSDMDAEIERLEEKRDKYTMLKQGMMQQLLTGRIRIYANN